MSKKKHRTAPAKAAPSVQPAEQESIRETAASVSEDRADTIPAAEKKETVPGAQKAAAPFIGNKLLAQAGQLCDRIGGVCMPWLAKFGLPDMLLARFIGVYVFLSGMNIMSARKSDLNAVTAWKDFIGGLNQVTWILWLIIGFAALTMLYCYLPKRWRVSDQIAMFSGTLFFAYALMWRNGDYYLALSVAAVVIVFVSYVMGKVKREQFEALPDLAAGIIVFGTAIVVTVFVSVTTVAHHRIFGTSCFDFGIFVQMFHSMVTDFTAETTCERDTLLSHFYVHASYIYYLFAPFYAIFRSENTLLVGQAVLAMGGIVPLFLMARKHGYKGFSLVSISMVYVFCAGVLGPCYYSFHENAFLPTLLMWTLYAMDQKKYILFYIMSVLVCIVKEDAPLYIICIALFFFFHEKSRKRFHGIILAALSGAYFVFIMDWLVKNGDGQMMTSSRFGHLTINPDDGFGGIIKNVLMDPGYFFSLFIQEDTLLFLLQVMVPLLFLPFVTREIHRFLLMIPFIIMNLVIGADYHYAADIGFQYIFGPACLLIYMLMLNCDDMKPERRNTLVTAAATVAFVTTISLLSGKISYWESYTARKDYYTSIEECLDSIPEDGSVAVNTWMLPHTADRKEVYTLDNNDFNLDPADQSFQGIREIERYDFFVLRNADEYTADVIRELEAAGYTLYNQIEGYMVIYVSPHYVFE